MKKIWTSFFLLSFISCSVFSQEKGKLVTVEEYEKLKSAGKLTNERLETVIQPNGPAKIRISSANPHVQASQCQCWVPLDASFSIVPFTIGTAPQYRNDDGSSPLLTLPFNFCFYGVNQTTCYINNNGNVSFGTAVAAFSANPFPNATDNMVAPFWSDVDTRNLASGLVYYKITPTYMIVKWDSVGYFASHADKRTTYQLIMTNGSDPILPSGKNVSFCYGKMEWTTGDASQGVNGFGGIPATVGVNRGNNIDYVQMGRFDNPSSVYNGPFGPPSGVRWLDNQSFYFNVCSNSNIPPIAAGVRACDTIRICVRDSFRLTVNWLSPEIGQITTASATGPTNFSIVSNVPGNTAVITTLFVPTMANYGYNTITYTAIDNGTPPASSTVVLVIRVDSLPRARAGPNQILCNGSVQLSATGGISYTWTPSASLSNPNISNPFASPNTTTSYTVTVFDGRCRAKDSTRVTTANSVVASAPVSICRGSSTVITATASAGSTLTWSPSATLSCSTCANPTATPVNTTTYIVTATDINGCIRRDSVRVTVNPLPVIGAGVRLQVICSGATANLQGTGPNGTAYSWTPSLSVLGPTLQNTTCTPTVTTTYTVTGTDVNGCKKSDTVKVTVIPAPVANPGANDSICIGSSVALNATGGGTYSWTPAAGLSSTTIPNPVATPTVTTTYTLRVAVGPCSGTATVVIKVNPIPTAVATSPPAICPGKVAFITGSGGGTYSWTPSTGLNSTTLSAPAATITATTTYTLTVTSPSGCRSTNVATATVTVLPKPIAAFTQNPLNNQYLNTPVLFSDLSTITPGSITAWLWRFGDNTTSTTQNPTHIYPLPGTYHVCLTAISQQGCIDTTCIDYNVIPPEVLAPNIITPNGDGVNDNLAFKWLELYPNNKLLVYDRWGVKIFEKSNYTNDWNGGNVSDGTYYYTLYCPQFKKDIIGFFQVIHNPGR